MVRQLRGRDHLANEAARSIDLLLDRAASSCCHHDISGWRFHVASARHGCLLLLGNLLNQFEYCYAYYCGAVSVGTGPWPQLRQDTGTCMGTAGQLVSVQSCRCTGLPTRRSGWILGLLEEGDRCSTAAKAAFIHLLRLARVF